MSATEERQDTPWSVIRRHLDRYESVLLGDRENVAAEVDAHASLIADALAEMEPERPTLSPVWSQVVATPAQLHAAPEWPLGLSSTYEAIRQGQIPTKVLAKTTYVLVAELRRDLGIDLPPVPA